MKRKNTERNKVIIAIVAVLTLLTLGLFLIIRGSGSEKIKEGQIQIKKGDQIVTINENGLIEYKSDKGVFYDTWSLDRTNAFFTLMEEKAKAYLAQKGRPKPPNAYEVKLYLNGEIVTIYLSEDEEILEEIFDDFDEHEDDPGGDLGGYFGNNTPTPQGSSNGGSNNATPTPYLFPTSNPTPTSGTSTGGGNTQQIQPDCDLYGTSVTHRTVISNEICTTPEEE